MNDASKNEAQAWIGSVLLHVLFFLLLAFGGFFAIHRDDIQKPIDVVLYDADAGTGPGGGGGGGDGSPAPKEKAAAPASAPEEAMAVSSDSIPEPTQEEKASEQTPATENHQTDVNSAAADSTNANVSEDGTGTGGSGTGSGGGNGSGIGEGTGSGTGPGSGSGTGGGNGSGVGTGNGSGTGDGNAMRPKNPPVLLAASEPVYPERLRREGAEGSVYLRLIVGADGSVEEASVSESSGYDEMDAAAISAAYEYRFEPAENAYGDPVRCAISTAVHFRLNW